MTIHKVYRFNCNGCQNHIDIMKKDTERKAILHLHRTTKWYHMENGLTLCHSCKTERR